MLDPRIGPTLALLAHAPSLRERARALGAAPPVEGSDAQLDQTHPQGMLPQVLAGQMAGVAAEHLFIWHLLLEHDVFPRYAHLTLLRSALEPAVTARWLLDGATTAARICRAVALLEEDVVEWRKIAASFEASHPGVVIEALADEQMAKIRADVDCSEFPARVPSHSDRVRDHAVHPGAKSDWIYRVLSSPAHGNTFSISTGEFGEALGSNMPGATARRVSPNTTLAFVATGIVLQTVEAAITDLERYTGTGQAPPG